VRREKSNQKGEKRRQQWRGEVGEEERGMSYTRRRRKEKEKEKENEKIHDDVLTGENATVKTDSE